MPPGAENELPWAEEPGTKLYASHHGPFHLSHEKSCLLLMPPEAEEPQTKPIASRHDKFHLNHRKSSLLLMPPGAKEPPWAEEPPWPWAGELQTKPFASRHGSFHLSRKKHSSMLMTPGAEEPPWAEESRHLGQRKPLALGRGAPDKAVCLAPWPISLEPREKSFVFIWCSDLLVL
jgi:hypothetical protein